MQPMAAHSFPRAPSLTLSSTDTKMDLTMYLLSKFPDKMSLVMQHAVQTPHIISTTKEKAS